LSSGERFDGILSLVEYERREGVRGLVETWKRREALPLPIDLEARAGSSYASAGLAVSALLWNLSNTFENFARLAEIETLPARGQTSDIPLGMRTQDGASDRKGHLLPLTLTWIRFRTNFVSA